MSLYVAEITYPGTLVRWDHIYSNPANLQGNEDFAAFSPPFQNIFQTLERSLNEAALALSFFEDSLPLAWELPSAEVRDRMRKERIRRTHEIERELKIHHNFNENDFSDARFQQGAQIRDEASLLFNRERWSRGEMPDSYRQLIPHMYARSFLYAMDRISKVLSTISRELRRAKKSWTFLRDDEKLQLDNDICSLEKIYEAFLAALPDLRGVRNSSAHIEDRLQFRREHDREINLAKGDQQ